MMNLLADTRTAVEVFKRLRNARKEGDCAGIKLTKSIPVYELGYGFLDTVEGSVLIHCSPRIYNTARSVFAKLPTEVKHTLTFSPNDGEFVERIKFWKEILRPVMGEKEYHAAIGEITHWFIHVKQIQ